jgi:hypothetical protein
VAELTVQERADNIAQWVKLTGEKQPAQVAPVNRGGRAPGGKPNQGGINAAVRDLGIDRTEAGRAVKIASIAPEAKQAAGDVGLDNNQSALLRAAKEFTPAAQVTVLHEIAERRAAKPVSPPRDELNDVEVQNKQKEALMRVWNVTCPEVREGFIGTVDRSVFDNTRAGAA